VMKVKGRESRVKSRKHRLALRSHFGSRLLTLDPRPARRGVTLVELLITILIISILAAAVLGVAAVAGETAREARTRNMIARIHTLLTEHYDSYKSRRVKLQPAVNAHIGSLTSTRDRGQAKQLARLLALRELMLMEMPDRWSDVLLESVPPASPTAPKVLPLYLAVPSTTGRTDLANVYLRHYGRIASSNNKFANPPRLNTPDEIRANQGAECLYMIIIYATADGEARTLFPASNIGDTDGDGAPEFLDGWGNPIGFLRWAPGFDSEIQSNANELDNPPSGAPVDAWAAAVNRDHDPFDLYRVESITAFRLVPLVYSGGTDEDDGLRTEDTYVTWRLTGSPSTLTTFPFFSPVLTPYKRVGTDNVYLGTDDGTQTATDNIHNHLIDTR